MADQPQEYIIDIDEDKIDEVLKYLADRRVTTQRIGTLPVYSIVIRPSEIKEYEKVPGITDLTENEPISRIEIPGPGVYH
jgi:hypothetical protein